MAQQKNEMKTLKLRWTGIRPLLMLNPQTVQVSNPYATVARELNEKMKEARKKGNGSLMVEIEQQQARNDWEGSTYWDQEHKSFYLPDSNILAVLKKGMGKLAKDIDRAVIISDADPGPSGVDNRIFIEISDKFANLDEAYEHSIELNGKLVHPYEMVAQFFPYRIAGPVRIPPKTGALIWKTRCMIPTGWKMVFTLEYDEDVLTDGSLIKGGFDAGRIVGIGSWRPKFGRFLQEVWHDGAWDMQYTGLESKSKPKARKTKKDEEAAPAE